MKRKCLSLLLGGMALASHAAGPASAKGDAYRLPPSSLVLFWAAWCAPCRSEVAAFPQLSAAVAPRNAMIVAMNDDAQSRAILAVLPADRVRFSNELLPALYRRLGIRGPVALPLGLMTDAGGRICATIAGGATVAAIQTASRQCSATGQAASR